MKIAELYPYAQCGQCGWMGRIIECVAGLHNNDDEACPECGLSDIQWMTSEEYVQELKESGCEDDNKS